MWTSECPPPCATSWRQWDFSQPYFTKRGKVGACFMPSCNSLWDNEIFLLSASGMKIGKINTRREERWGYLARTISHLFPFFISRGRTKNALAEGKINYGLELVIPTGSPPWVKNLKTERSWGRLVLRNTNTIKYKYKYHQIQIQSNKNTNWFTALGQKSLDWKELRSTCLKKYKLFI